MDELIPPTNKLHINKIFFIFLLMINCNRTAIMIAACQRYFKMIFLIYNLFF